MMNEREDYQMKRAEFLNPEADVIEFETKDVFTLTVSDEYDDENQEDAGNLFG